MKDSEIDQFMKDNEGLMDDLARKPWEKKMQELADKYSPPLHPAWSGELNEAFKEGYESGRRQGLEEAAEIIDKHSFNCCKCGDCDEDSGVPEIKNLLEDK